MILDSYFEEIMKYAHFWNWLPDWELVQKVYNEYPETYSILLPFAYSYLEEIIRSTTTEYGREIMDEKGVERKRKTGIDLINLAINQNRSNIEYVTILKGLKNYFSKSKAINSGDNRNGVSHGYMHPRFWHKEDFEKLICDIAEISKYSKF